jgi:hypothetical protein
MENDPHGVQQDPAMQKKVLALGAGLGAIVGLAGAYLLLRNLEKEGSELKISSGEGLRLSLLLLGTLRQIATLHE